MPFESRSQMRRFFAMERRGELPKGKAKEWAHETPNIGSLPERKKKKKKGTEKKAMEKRGMFFEDRDLNAAKDGMFFKRAANDKVKDIDIDKVKGTAEKLPTQPPKPAEKPPKAERIPIKPEAPVEMGVGCVKKATDQSNDRVQQRSPRAGDEQNPTPPGAEVKQEGSRSSVLAQTSAGKKTFTPPEKVASDKTAFQPDRASQMASTEQTTPAGYTDRSGSAMPMFGIGIGLKKKTVKQAAESSWEEVPGKGLEAVKSVGEGAGRAASGAMDYIKNLPDWAKAALVGLAGYKGIKLLGRAGRAVKGKVAPPQGIISRLLGK